MSDVSRYNEVRKQMEVLEMFRHKKEKRIVELLLYSDINRSAVYLYLVYRTENGAACVEE